jgi:hypothetical protein
MADSEDHPEANQIAKWTFWFTAALAVLFFGCVLAFVLYR